MNDMYTKLKNNPIKVVVVDNPREVHFGVVSCMCDIRNTISFRRREDGSYSVDGGRSSMSNFQIPHDEIDLTWHAEDGKWQEIANMINKGTSQVEKVRSR